MRLLHLQFRFTEPADVEAYGDRWWDYDEGLIVRLPARRLIELERTIGESLITVMNGMRDDSVLGDLACSWLAMHLADPAKAGEFASYSPVVMLMQWRGAPRDNQPEEDPADPLAPAPPSSRGLAPE